MTRPRSSSAFAIAIGGLIAMAIGIGVGRFVYTPILPPMAAALGLTRTEAGLIASANFAGYLVGALATMRAILPGSRRVWLLSALAGSAVTTGMMGLTISVPLFILLRFLGGVASALVLILASAHVLERLGEMGRSGLMALHFAGVGMGIALSAAVVAGLLEVDAAWSTMWLASGGLSLAGMGAVAVLLSGAEAPAVIVSRASADRAGVGPYARGITLAHGLFGFGYVITTTFLVMIVRAAPEIRALELVIWIIVGLAAAPSVWLWTHLARRIGTPRAYSAAALVEAAGVMASVVWRSPAGLCFAAILVGGTFMGLTALGLSHVRDLARIRGDDGRRAIAAITGAFGVGQIAGPMVAGAISDRLGGFLAPSFAAAGALILAAWLARR